jgi:hypothetical protein
MRNLPQYKYVYETEESRTTDKPTGVACVLWTGEIDNKTLETTSVSKPGKIRMDTSIPLMDKR